MYGLNIEEEDALLIETLHGIAEGEIRNAARQAEKARAIPDSVVNSLHQMGVAAPVPEDHGGQGLPNLATSLRIAEELAWGDPAIARGAIAAGHAALLIAECGTPKQKAKFLPRFVAEEPLRASVLVCEGFGRQPSESQTRAERSASGWTLHGEKLGVLHAADAELSVVIARESASAGDSIAAFIVEGVPDGWNVLRDDREIGLLGLEAAPTARLRLDAAAVAADGRLEGGLALARALARIRLGHAATMLGCSRASKEFAQDYANERIAFGRPISSFQGVAFILADRDMAIDAARMELFAAADEVIRLELESEIENVCRLVVDRCGQVALETTRDGVQTLGGHGFIREYPVERWYRAAASLCALDFDPLAAQVAFL